MQLIPSQPSSSLILRTRVPFVSSFNSSRTRVSYFYRLESFKFHGFAHILVCSRICSWISVLTQRTTRPVVVGNPLSLLSIRYDLLLSRNPQPLFRLSEIRPLSPKINTEMIFPPKIFGSTPLWPFTLDTPEAVL